MSELEKLDLGSGDPDMERREKLVELFPEACEDGKIDLGALTRALGDVVEDGDERYAFTWPGKTDSIRQSQIPSKATLRPCLEKSVGWDTTRNLYIEGDNLEVLKLLQRAYHGKVKMIYIDPPYNTGHDFVYKDSFGDSVENYKEQAGLSGQSNAETSGRFHSAWCSMMYPRLKLARELLSDDGVIFISIDDNEVGNLRKICEEIFEESNFLANLVWEKKYTVANDAKYFSANHDHILVFARQINSFVIGKLPRTEKMNEAYKNPDGHPKGPWKATPLHAKSGSASSAGFSYTFKNGVVYSPPAGTYPRYSAATLSQLDDDDEIWFGSDGLATPSRKTFLSELNSLGVVPRTIIPFSEGGHNHEAVDEVKLLFGDNLFSDPKPTRLIQLLTRIGNVGDQSLVLDFFSGSATTADAVMRQNLSDGKSRRFILVQLPEGCPKGSEAAKAGYDTLCDVGEERIRRAGKKITSEFDEANLQPSFDEEPKIAPDVGFRVLSLDESCFGESDGTQLFDSVIKEDRSDQDVIMEVMLKWGLEPTLPVERVEAAGYPCWSVAKGELVCCMAEGLSMGALEAIAAMSPRRVLILDRVLDDSLKLNASYIFGKGTPEGDEIELRTV